MTEQLEIHSVSEDSESSCKKSKLPGWGTLALVGSMYACIPNVSATPYLIGTSSALVTSTNVVSSAKSSNRRGYRYSSSSSESGTNQIITSSSVHNKLDAILKELTDNHELKASLESVHTPVTDNYENNYQLSEQYEGYDFLIKKLTLQKTGEMLTTRALESNFKAPNFWAVEHAQRALDLLNSKNISQEFLNPSPEGGIIIEFYNNDNYYLIEFFNDEEVVFLKRDPNKRRSTWDLTSNNYLNTIEREIQK